MSRRCGCTLTHISGNLNGRVSHWSEKSRWRKSWVEVVIISYLSHTHTHSVVVGGLSSQSLTELKASGGLYLT